MKLISGLLALLISTYASAQTSDVHITSFFYTGAHSTAAELCGNVSNPKGNEVIQINVDPNSKSPAHYTALVSNDGTFCVVVSTLTGEATAAIRGAPHLELTLANAGVSRADSRAPHPPAKNWFCRAHAFDSSFPDYSGSQSLSRYTAEENAIYSCQIYQRKRCVAGACYQQ
jgi:hypothetical protein